MAVTPDTRCDLCWSANLALAYVPQSPRGLTVHVCADCGLTQSLPRRDRAARRGASVSSGADWGNVRYGKGFRTAANLEWIKRHADIGTLETVLDVGSNRGVFVAMMRAAAPGAHLIAVEPDVRFSASYQSLRGVDFINARIEDVSLPPASLDLVYSCHTLEHVAPPLHVLKQHARALKPGGLMFLEVPNMALIGDADIVEEWFIDKHLFHFTRSTLCRVIHQAGFEIVEAPDPTDRVNLSLVARKTGASNQTCDPGAAAEAMALVAAYEVNRRRNQGRLEAAARAIERFGPERIAIWGAGRLFDSLVVQGRLDPKALAAVVDRHLPEEARVVAGVTVARPDILAGRKTDVIVVMSRSFAHDIHAEASALAPGATLVAFNDLLEGNAFPIAVNRH